MTSRAWWTAVAALLLAAPGVALQWPELLAIAVGLVALLIVPAILRLPASASWTDEGAPTRVTRGDTSEVVVAVIVTAALTRWVSAVDDSLNDRVFLPAHTRSLLSWPIDTSRRGLFHVGPSRLEVGDPFGLAVRVLATREPSPVLIVPRVHPVDARISRRSDPESEAEEHPGCETFHSLREYVVGDPQKLVHWKSTARTGKVMVRRMVDITVPWLLVVLDVNARAYDRPGALFEDFDDEAFESTVDTAASWAWHGCGTDQRVLLTTTSLTSSSVAVEVTPRTRESALDWLAVVEPHPAETCGPGRAEALARRQGVSCAVVVTGNRIETTQPWIARWQRTLPVAVVRGDT